MGRAFEMITGLVTAPTGAFTAAAALTGNSFTVRDSRSDVRMVARWDTRQATGITRITSPLLHDSSIGMQHGADDAQTRIQMMMPPQRLYPQDALTVEMTGSAVAGDIEFTSYLVEYTDLPGVQGRFINEAELIRRAESLFSNTITIATGATGQYSGQVAINSAQDQFKANTDYALIGYQVTDAGVHAIRYVGPDWGNIGVGGPGIDGTLMHDTSDWFLELSRFTGRACIPVMNSANKSLTLIDAAVDENGVNPIVTTMWVELR
jgi:hypothetical protein